MGTALLRSPKTARLTGRAALEAAYKAVGVRKPRSQAEFRLTCGIAKLLRDYRRPGVIAFHVPNGERRSAATGARLRSMGVMPGVGDFIVLAEGLAGALEIKVRGGDQSDSQEAFQCAWEAAGGVYAVATGWDEAVSVLKLWGVLPPDFISDRRKQMYLPFEEAA